VPSVGLGKATAAIAGTTGTGSLGAAALAVARAGSGHAVPAGLWAALASSAGATVMIATLGLILEYRLKKLAAETQHKEALAAAEIQKERLAIHRTVLEKAAGEPASSGHYRDLIIADALHLSVEQNGSRPADRTHGRLYGPRPADDRLP
jgi:hypothetical protein